MSKGVNIDITGIREADELLSKLSSGQVKRVFRSAYRRAARPLIKAARRNLKGTGYNLQDISRSLGTKALGINQVGVKVGARQYGSYKGQLAHTFDQGTEERGYTNKNGVYHRTGKILPSNFWTDAFEQSEDEIKDRIRDDMIKALHQFVKRQNKKVAL